MIDVFVKVILILFVCLQAALVYLVFCMIRAINKHNSAVRPDVPVEEGGIDLRFFERPHLRRATTFTQKSSKWINDHEKGPIGGEIIGK